MIAIAIELRIIPIGYAKFAFISYRIQYNVTTFDVL